MTPPLTTFRCPACGRLTALKALPSRIVLCLGASQPETAVTYPPEGRHDPMRMVYVADAPLADATGQP